MSTWHPDYLEPGEHGLNPTELVYEKVEKKTSKLLDQDGNPIPYQSKKLGYIGFTKLKERP